MAIDVSRWTGLLILSAALGCAATEPVVYAPRAQQGRADAIVRECRVRAQEAAAGTTAGRVVRGGIQRSQGTVPLGAAVGAVAGGGKGAATGAGVGVVVALAGAGIGALEKDSLYASYMQLCLQDQGVTLVGWR